MSDPISLLPRSSTSPYELAISLTSAGQRPVPYHALRDIWYPWACPEAFLPYLGRALGVRLWRDDWPLAKKRYAVAMAKSHARYSGTEWLYDEYLRLMGSRLVRVTWPPDKTYLGASETIEERAAFLARFPQLRIHPYVETVTDRIVTTTTSAGGRPKHYLGLGYPADSDARRRNSRIARLYEPRDGSLTDLTYREVTRLAQGGTAQVAHEVLLPGRPSRAIYPGGRPKARWFFGGSGAAARTVTIWRPQGYEWALRQVRTRTVPAGFDPISVVPELVREISPGPSAAFFPGAGRPIDGAHLRPSTAWRRIYERYHLHDPERLPEGRGARTFLGRTRLGQAPFTARFLVDVPASPRPRAAGRFVGGFLTPGNRRPLTDAVEAVTSAKALADTALISTRVRQPATVGDRIPVGAGRVGGYV